MEPNEIEFDGRYRLRALPLLGTDAQTVRVVERLGTDAFAVRDEHNELLSFYVSARDLSPLEVPS